MTVKLNDLDICTTFEGPSSGWIEPRRWAGSKMLSNTRVELADGELEGTLIKRIIKIDFSTCLPIGMIWTLYLPNDCTSNGSTCYHPQLLLRKGNVFTSICMSTGGKHGEGGMHCKGGHAWWSGWKGSYMAKGVCVVKGACMAGGHVWQGVCMAEGECMAERACMAGSMWWGMHGGGISGRACMHGRRDDHCSRWYTSYWNAFLFISVFTNKQIDNIGITDFPTW